MIGATKINGFKLFKLRGNLYVRNWLTCGMNGKTAFKLAFVPTSCLLNSVAASLIATKCFA